MDTIDRLDQRLKAIKEKLKITEMDVKNIDIALEDWVVEKIQNKLKEEGWSKDE